MFCSPHSAGLSRVHRGDASTHTDPYAMPCYRASIFWEQPPTRCVRAVCVSTRVARQHMSGQGISARARAGTSHTHAPCPPDQRAVVCPGQHHASSRIMYTTVHSGCFPVRRLRFFDLDASAQCVLLRIKPSDIYATLISSLGARCCTHVQHV